MLLGLCPNLWASALWFDSVPDQFECCSFSLKKSEIHKSAWLQCFNSKNASLSWTKHLNPNEALGLLIYTTKVTNNFLKFRESWLHSWDQLVFNCHWLGCQWTSWLGYLQLWADDIWLRKLRVRDELRREILSPRIHLACLHSSSYTLIRKNSPQNLQSMHIRPLSMTSHLYSPH